MRVAPGHGQAHGILRWCPRSRVAAPKQQDVLLGPLPDFVSFYRWHLPDPIIFRETFTAAIQQIGAIAVPEHLTLALDMRRLTREAILGRPAL